ncbi:MAG TPA: hypothetical protein VIY53_01120 [Acidobacteriaceae bacterium]
MVIHLDQLGLDGLAVVVTFGIGFLIWTLAHLVRESRSHDNQGQLFIASRPRR